MTSNRRLLWRRFFLPILFFLLFYFGNESFFKNGILLKFLLNQSFQFQRWGLQKGKRLLELGSQYLVLAHPLS